MKTYTLQEMKRMNKKAGKFFFDRGNPPVLNKKGNFLVTRVSNGYAIYEFNPKTGDINFVDNPRGEYSWQPHKTRAEAVRYAELLNSRVK